MQPPLEHPIDYKYETDEVMDRRRRGWSLLMYGTVLAFVLLLFWMLR